MPNLILLQEHIPKLILAAIIGGAVGLERSNRGVGIVGYGTLAIITIGCTLLTILSVHALDGSDPSRLIANIISSIGFLAGGVIYTRRIDNDKELVGLTTGTVIFTLSAIGITIGLGYYGLAIVTAVLVELNILISKLIKKSRKNDNNDNDDME
ncbi:MgtC/SapB family protein [Romboutsia sp.]|uniref:MgtC/SapB family protein n=1 Tax=Romboutsia sp. TaxID=1965302 RepID=UPI003F3DD856